MAKYIEITIMTFFAGVFVAHPQNLSRVAEFDSRAHFHSLYEKGDMYYSIDKNDIADFYGWQAAFRTELKKALGLSKIEQQLKSYKPVAVQIDSEDVGYAMRERWKIWTEPTVPLPFIVMRPKNLKGKAPLMITPHGHGKNTESYAGVYHTEKEREEGEDGERDIAVQAVKAGFIAIAPTTRGFGKTRTPEAIGKDEVSSCRILLMHDLLVGRTPIGDRVWDVMRLIDWALENLPVDASKIIVSGNSGGGTVTLFAGAIDTRIAMSLPGSYFNTFVGSVGTLHHCDCNYVPDILNLGEMYDVAGLTAPRYFCAVHGKKDPIFPISETRKSFAKLQKIYGKAGAAGRCELYEGEEGHRYYKDGAWAFIHKHLDELPRYGNLGDRLGVCTSVKKASIVRQAGGTYIEVSVSGFLVPEKSDEDFIENLQMAKTSVLPITSANGFFPWDIKLVGPEADFDRALKYTEIAMKRAAQVGIKTCVLGSSGARNIPDGFDRAEAETQFVEVCRGLAAIAEKYGVVIVIEPLRHQETNFINTVREGLKIVRQVNHPNLCVLADFYHMAVEGEDAGAIVEAGKYLRHCHIAEKEARTPPGVKGDDFTSYFEALDKIGYQGNISIECGWENIESQVSMSISEIKGQIQSINQ